jgi:RNA polymerase sigma factor (sigma-70 family)
MAKITEADKYLIDQIRAGNAEGWSQLVARYQGRLIAFARGQLSRKSEAEDLVQDTLVMFLQSLKSFKDECSLETYLFTILRRKIIDLYRGTKLRACFINDVMGGGEKSEREFDVGSSDPTASWYVRRDEQAERAKRALAAALEQVIGKLKESENFRDLKIIEMAFYGQIRNKTAAQIVDVDEKQIALIKHRLIKTLHEKLAAQQAEPSDSALTEVWEENRFTCPKRSTIGRFLLETLEEPWKSYVDFHVNRLGCRFCRANVEDLQKANEAEQQKAQKKFFESTIGFFRPTAK